MLISHFIVALGAPVFLVVVNISREALCEATYLQVVHVALCLNSFDSFHERSGHGMKEQ